MLSDRAFRFGVKPLAFLLMLAPFALLVFDYANDALGANPVETLSHRTGDWTLRYLLLGLAMTPLRRVVGWGWPIRLRRMIGLFAFFYACMHFLVWLLDQGLLWETIVEDVFKRPYITVGFTAFLMLIPLAVTSNSYAMRRLGQRWKQLHRLVYPIAILGVLHYLWLVKVDVREPLVYGGVLMALLATRFAPSANLWSR